MCHRGEVKILENRGGVLVSKTVKCQNLKG